MQSNLLINRINIPIIVIIFFTISCGHPGPRELEEARKQAILAFGDFTFENRIDAKYFKGPTFIEEKDENYTFNWITDIPNIKPTVFEAYVPKDSKIEAKYGTKGRSLGYLCGTHDYPLSEAVLSNLFHLALNNSEPVLRLRKTLLASDQLEDVANFSVIGSDLDAYAYCYNCSNPDSISWFKNIKERNYKIKCTVFELDSIYTHDRYGSEYYYRNFIQFIVLGTPGANRIWDFEPAILDSLYNDKLEHIYTNGDDIIVKLIPKSLGCD